jgi:transcriptional regulator with XRE-family HTH domain
MSDEATPPRGRLREHVAEEIRVLLARRKMSATQLAHITGIKQSSLSRRMTGETAFDMDDLERIADALGVAVTDLMPQRVSTGTEPNRVFTPISRLQAPEPPAQPRRSPRRPSGRTSREDRRPRQVRSPGHTMPSAYAA